MGVSWAVLLGSRLQSMESQRNFLNTAHMNAFSRSHTQCSTVLSQSCSQQTHSDHTAIHLTDKIAEYWVPTGQQHSGQTEKKHEQFHKLFLIHMLKLVAGFESRLSGNLPISPHLYYNREPTASKTHSSVTKPDPHWFCCPCSKTLRYF